MAFTLVSLNVAGTVIDELTIHSFEMGLYLAKVQCQGQTGFILQSDLLQKGQRRPQRFKSVTEVLQLLDKAQVKNAVLLHQSAYDEMVGQGGKVDNSLRLVLI